MSGPSVLMRLSTGSPTSRGRRTGVLVPLPQAPIITDSASNRSAFVFGRIASLDVARFGHQANTHLRVVKRLGVRRRGDGSRRTTLQLRACSLAYSAPRGIAYVHVNARATVDCRGSRKLAGLRQSLRGHRRRVAGDASAGVAASGG